MPDTIRPGFVAAGDLTDDHRNRHIAYETEPGRHITGTLRTVRQIDDSHTQMVVVTLAETLILEVPAGALVWLPT